MNSEYEGYTPLREIKIAGINTLVEDRHNEVLSFWYSLNRFPAVLIHIDDHSDMSAGSRTFANAKNEYPYAKIATLDDYVKNCLGIESFISVAMHDGKIGAVYHIAPRHNKIGAYGRVQEDKFVGAPKTVVDNSGRIRWQDGKLLPSPEIILENELVQDINGTTHPIILDIDLDAFHLNQVDPQSLPYSPQMDKVRRVLERLPRPNMITIARSQTPTTYVNPMLVDRIQTECIQLLEELYRR